MCVKSRCLWPRFCAVVALGNISGSIHSAVCWMLLMRTSCLYFMLGDEGLVCHFPSLSHSSVQQLSDASAAIWAAGIGGRPCFRFLTCFCPASGKMHSRWDDWSHVVQSVRWCRDMKTHQRRLPLIKAAVIKYFTLKMDHKTTWERIIWSSSQLCRMF